MKFPTSIFIVGFLAIGVVSATPLENDLIKSARLTGILENLVNNTLNSILKGVKDPIKMDKLNVNSSNEILDGFFNFEDLNIYGVKQMVATKLKVDFLSLALKGELHLNQVQIGTKYAADATLAALVPLYGNGRASITLDDIHIAISGKVKTKGGLGIGNVTVSFTLGDGIVQLSGLLDNEDFSVLTTTVINNNLVRFINDNVEAFSKILSPIANQLVQNVLGGGGKKKSAELLELQELFDAELAELIQ